MQERINHEALVQRGLKALAQHRPDLALGILRSAVDAIPPSCSEELSKALYWLSVALRRLDQKDLAVKSLASAQKLRRRGFARRLYLRSVNEYGMPKQPTAELDDFYAYMSIQMSAYLVRRPTRKFESFSEREAVMRILLDGWKLLKEMDDFKSADCGEKLFSFRAYRPRFPDFGLSASSSRLLRPSFGSRAASGSAQIGAAQASDPRGISRRCACGSGLPYSQCCGRVQSLREI